MVCSPMDSQPAILTISPVTLGKVMFFDDQKRFESLFAWLHRSLVVLLERTLINFWLIARRNYIILDPLSLMELLILPTN